MDYEIFQYDWDGKNCHQQIEEKRKKKFILNSKSLNPLDPFHQPTNPSGLIFLYLTDLVEY